MSESHADNEFERMTTMDQKYEALFTPWKIGNVEIKNRLVQTSMGGTSLFGWLEPNHFDKEAAKFIMNRAKDGVGLILLFGKHQRACTAFACLFRISASVCGEQRYVFVFGRTVCLCKILFKGLLRYYTKCVEGVF